MKYIFDEKIPYEFKDVTGLSEDDNIGQSILDGDKVIGGIILYRDKIPMPNVTISFVTICGIEILPEYRNKGIGTTIVKQILSECDCVHAAVQNDKAWKWWKDMGAKEYMAVMFPEDVGKENPRAHTLAFVLGKDEHKTRIYRSFFQLFSSQMNGVFQSKSAPQIDFSVNKK